MPTPSPLSWTPCSIGAAALGYPTPSARRCEFVGTWPARPRLAVVGSRAAHRHVLAALPALLELAMLRGWALVSGGAIGVDGGAHRAALAHGMPQLAVLPCGRDRLYPARHASMFDAMRRSGRAGLLFAHPPATTPQRGLFAARNALIVNLADAVLVAEAGLRSGSRGTGELSLRRERPTAVLLGSAGCGALLGQGAHALPEPTRTATGGPALRDAFASWLDALGGHTTAPAPHLVWPSALEPLRQRMLLAGPQGASLEQLGQRWALALLEAELDGLVVEAAPGRWVCAS